MRRRWARLRALSPAQYRIVVAALVLLPLVQLSLRTRGFTATTDALARRSHGPRRRTDVDDARSLAEAVAVVAGRPVITARCLGRSIVLWYLLRRRGVDADLIIGATGTQADEPLAAHAWVEVDGQPVNDRDDVRDRFPAFDLPLPRLEPT